MAKVLLIDDDTVILKLYSTKLTSDGHTVQTATNGEEGLKHILSFKPDIIMLDLLMPKLNGFSFLEELKKNPATQNIPKIVFSSVANQEQINRLNNLGVTTFLNKIETTPTQLVQAMNQVMSQPPASAPQTPSASIPTQPPQAPAVLPPSNNKPTPA
jgi:CheY-like chemotaxis protein